MVRQVIALCDPDLDYAIRVANAVNRYERRDNIELIAFGNPDGLAAFLESERPGMIAVNAIWKGEMKKPAGDIPVVWLTEDRQEISGGGPHVFKYTAVPQLIRTLLHESGLEIQRTEPAGREKQEAAVIAVWSAGGGAGKSTVAALLAEELGKLTGSGIFCLSLEAGATAGLWLSEEGRHDASEWLYEMKSGRMEPATQHSCANPSVESFRNDVPIREFAMLSKSDAQVLIRRAASISGCKAVVIDCETGWSERTESAWETSDLIVCVGSEDPAGRYKTKKWLAEWPGWQEGGAFRRKSVFVANKAMPAVSNLRESDSYSLPYVPEWKQSSVRELHRYPAFRQSFLHMVGGIAAAVMSS